MQEVKNKFDIRLQELHLTNFRGFEELKVQFDRQLTVFIGRNGAGKTTILDGTASLLQFMIDKIKRQPGSNKSTILSEKDIRNGTKEAVNTISISFEKEKAAASSHEEEDENEMNLEENSVVLSWYGSLTKSGFDKDTITEENAFTDLETTSQAIERQLKREEPASLPVIVYYPCDHATDTPSTNGEGDKIEAYNAYDDALTTKSFDFYQFFLWYKWRQELALYSDSRRDILKDVTEKAVCEILSDEANQFSSLKYRPLVTHKEGDLAIEKNGELLSANQFSSGEKMLFALVADLARRLALANPKVENPLHGNGIVLIDEIDLHLHPAKQREVLPKLLKIFPNIQFVVTTHSPVVVNNLDPETTSVLMLNEGAVLPMKHFAGRNIAELMYEYYGIPSRPKDVQQKIDEVFSLIENEQIVLAKTKLAYLEERLGEEDSAVLDATNSIQLLEQML